MKEVLKIVETNISELEKIHGEIIKYSEYGNCIVMTFKDGKKYKITLPSLLTTQPTLD